AANLACPKVQNATKYSNSNGRTPSHPEDLAAKRTSSKSESHTGGQKCCVEKQRRAQFQNGRESTKAAEGGENTGRRTGPKGTRDDVIGSRTAGQYPP